MGEDLEYYLENINFEQQLKKLETKLKNKKIIIYGAGQLFEYINIKYDISNLNIIGISDGKYTEKDKNEYFKGYKKIIPNEIKLHNPDYIIICILNYKNITKYLKENKLIDNKIKTIPFAAPKANFKFFEFNSNVYAKKLCIFNKEFNFPNKKFRAFKHELYLHKIELLKNYKRLTTASIMHQKTFGEFRNKYQGKDIVLIGGGPTLNYFKPIKDAIYVGCNRAFLYDKVNFDFLFTIDKGAMEAFYDEFIQYRKNDCIKFIGDQNQHQHYHIPQYVINESNGRPYKTQAGIHPCTFTLDIDTEPLGNFATVTLQAMQFILFTNPKRVYIVGIDCNSAEKGHFQGKTRTYNYRGESQEIVDKRQKKQWFDLKQFLKICYPKTEIISINPVGLKGYFKDVYTQEYINSNPELFKNEKDIEIIG